MRLYLSHGKVPRLGSFQDKVIRQYIDKESEKEVKKTEFLALLVMNSIPFTNKSDSDTWESKVKKLWSKYLGLEYGVEIPEHTDKETSMMSYYQKVIKNIKAKLTRNKDGKLSVTGLDSLKE